MGNDFDNPFGKKTQKRQFKEDVIAFRFSNLSRKSGWALEHVVAAKAVAFKEALSEEFLHYILQVKKNAKVMSDEFLKRGYNIISGGTDNHMMLIDLRNKNITGKDAEAILGTAEITVNKNMVPFDDKSPFVTSGIRVGTAAITTRGLKEEDMV